MTKAWLKTTDEELFRYLHAVKIATVQQANRDVYRYQNLHSLYDRIRLWQKSGYLAETASAAFPRQKLIHLTRAGFDRFVANGDEQIVELRSDAIVHDIALVDIRQLLLATSNIDAFYAENTLQTWPEYRNRDALRAFVEKRCDGVVKAKLRHGSLHLAVEFEASLKSASRIVKILQCYYGEEMIPAVLLISADEMIQRRFITLEKQHYGTREPKFLYACLGQLHRYRDLVFTDRCGQTLTLSMGGVTFPSCRTDSQQVPEL